MPDASAALARHLLDAFPPSRAYAKADLDRLPLPLGHFLSFRLDERVANAAHVGEAWVDAEAPAVRAAADVFRQALADHARIPAAEWEAALTEAVERVVAYLADPVATASAFAFEGPEGTLTAEPLLHRMAAFSPYPYLREIAERFFQRKAVEAMDRAAFERLLRRIDRQMVAGFGPADWLTLLDPLFDLLAPLSPEGLPTPLLQRLFEAKGLGDFARDLEGPETYTQAGLRYALEEAFPELDDEAPAPPEAAPLAVVESEPAAPETEEGVVEASVLEEAPEEPSAAATPEEAMPEEPGPEAPPQDESTSAEEPLWKRLARHQEEAAFAPPPSAPVEEEPLWKQLARQRGDSAEPPPASPTPPTGRRPPPLAQLEARVLGDGAAERRDWFVRALAGGSEVEYRRVLELLDRAASWDEAWPIIARELFRKHGVNIYDEAAVAFTDAVEARFSQRG